MCSAWRVYQRLRHHGTKFWSCQRTCTENSAWPTRTTNKVLAARRATCRSTPTTSKSPVDGPSPYISSSAQPTPLVSASLVGIRGTLPLRPPANLDLFQQSGCSGGPTTTKNTRMRTSNTGWACISASRLWPCWAAWDLTGMVCRLNHDTLYIAKKPNPSISTGLSGCC